MEMLKSCYKDASNWKQNVSTSPHCDCRQTASSDILYVNNRNAVLVPDMILPCTGGVLVCTH